MKKISTYPFRLSNVDGNHLRSSLIIIMEKTVNQCSVKKFSEWQFSHPKLLSLPLDLEKVNYVRRNVKEAVFSLVLPTPLNTELKMVAFSEDALINIDMDPRYAESSDFKEFIAGNKLLPSSTPLAHRYGGHQFGYWAMQLGDGRALLLGEYVNRAGERWELQLKGAGKTPYSRDADGRAVLRSSVREFLCSEAMYYLGIPTSRAAAIVVSNDEVIRDQFYNGFPKKERATVVLRLAPSWFRFGSLEILARNRELTSLKKLVDFIITEHYPSLNLEEENKYVLLFDILAHKVMEVAVDWMRVGFAHGVLNTDNMSMLGITIDYGPFGFVEAYDSQFIPNSSDREGRYSYGNQLEIVVWNLEKLSISMAPLLNESQVAELSTILQNVKNYGSTKYKSTFLRKLGLKRELDANTDHQLIKHLLKMMEETGSDFTVTFRQLGEVPLSSLTEPEILQRNWSLQMLARHESYNAFIQAYANRVKQEEGTDEERRKIMSKVNPKYVLRNWMAQSAIEKAENDDFSEVRFLLEVLKSPFTVNEEAEKKGYADRPPNWASGIKVSCSS